MLKHIFILFTAVISIASAAEQMDPAKMQEMMMKAGMPGPEHQVLAKLAGEWDVASKCWMEPGKPPMESMGSAKFEVIFDGRFVTQEFTGEMMGKPFQGMGVEGFDNLTKKFQTGWIDSMSTTVHKLEGESKDGGKTIEYAGTMSCPMEDGPVNTRWVHKTISDDSFTFEMYMSPKGAETKSMELTYTRKK